jgi:hypothetical protein
MLMTVYLVTRLSTSIASLVSLSRVTERATVAHASRGFDEGSMYPYEFRYPIKA